MKSIPKVISRRRLVQSSAAIAAGLASPAIARGAAPRALALIGDRYHNSDYIRVTIRLTMMNSLPIFSSLTIYSWSFGTE
jgi:hypothetical protein